MMRMVQLLPGLSVLAPVIPRPPPLPERCHRCRRVGGQCPPRIDARGRIVCGRRSAPR
jgi:hypothetical protein